jgi:hypothetical protein
MSTCAAAAQCIPRSPQRGVAQACGGVWAACDTWHKLRSGKTLAYHESMI